MAENYYRKEIDGIRAFEITKKLQVDEKVTVFYPHNFLCDKTECHSYDGDTFYYIDDDHLSNKGAMYILRSLDIQRTQEPKQ